MKRRISGIMDARTYLGLSMKELAQVVGCDESTVHRWQGGASAPSRVFQTRLAGVIELVAQMSATFPSAAAGREWLQRPLPQLEGVRPVEHLMAGRAELLTGLILGTRTPDFDLRIDLKRWSDALQAYVDVPASAVWCMACLAHEVDATVPPDAITPATQAWLYRVKESVRQVVGAPSWEEALRMLDVPRRSHRSLAAWLEIGGAPTHLRETLPAYLNGLSDSA